MDVRVRISPGELIDKITILEIKLERISDKAKSDNVRKGFDLLTRVYDENISASDRLSRIIPELKAVNEKLWDIEDDIRDCERRKDFSERFIELARSVYKTNDKRATIKRQIDELLNSGFIIEEKSYKEY